MRKLLLATECEVGLGQLGDRLLLTAEVMEPGAEYQGVRLAVGVGQLAGQGERLLFLLEGLVRITQHPESESCPQVTNHPGVLTIKRDKVSVPTGVIEGYALFQVSSGLCQPSWKERGLTQYPVSHQEVRRVLQTLGQGEELFPQFTCRPEVRSYQRKVP